MKIQEFSPKEDRSSLLRFYEVFDAASRYDDPNGPQVTNFVELLPKLADPVRGLLGGSRSFGGWWSLSLAGHSQRVGLARTNNGEVVGGYLIELPGFENTDVALCSAFVTPSQRRRGVGRQLLHHCAQIIADAGGNLIIGYVRDGSSGSGFVQAIGAKAAGTTDVRRVLEINESFVQALPGLWTVANEKAKDYSLVSWKGPVPEEYLDDYVCLYNTMADAPRPDAMVSEQWNAHRVRETEEEDRKRDLTTLHVAAQELASGNIVAYTTIVLDPVLPEWAFQNATVVTRPHRGRRLGLFTKAGLSQMLIDHYPATRHVMTTNDETNKHIIKVNEQFGFRVSDSFSTWEIRPTEILRRK